LSVVEIALLGAKSRAASPIVDSIDL
jgi:hypothetical protein